MPNPRLATHVDDFSLILEKVECLLAFALGDIDAQKKYQIVILAIIEDYVGELRQLSTHLSERRACQ